MHLVFVASSSITTVFCAQTLHTSTTAPLLNLLFFLVVQEFLVFFLLSPPHPFLCIFSSAVSCILYSNLLHFCFNSFSVSLVLFTFCFLCFLLLVFGLSYDFFELFCVSFWCFPCFCSSFTTLPPSRSFYFPPSHSIILLLLFFHLLSYFFLRSGFFLFFSFFCLASKNIFGGVLGIPGLYEQAAKVITEKLTAMQELRMQPTLTYEQLHAFGDLAHSMKSGVCMIGLARLALLCGKLGTTTTRLFVLFFF
jgi:hypothetical protein